MARLFSAEAEVVACDLETGAALLDLRSSTYFSLNPVASIVWQTLATPVSAERLVEEVIKRFDAPTATVASDVDALLDEMSRLKLISTHDG